MIRFIETTFENFGPLKGVQKVGFPDGGGVIIVYGENNKGKTTLLNAWRFAFTGRALSRTGVRPSEQIINRLALAEDPRSIARVLVKFEEDGVQYELTRSVGIEGDGKVAQHLILSRDGTMLSQSDAERRLAELMPENLQRFFFFDGEDLEAYEGLVSGDGASQEKLKADIDNLLGVPIALNAAKDCNEFALVKGNEIANAAKHDLQLKTIGQALEQAQANARRHRENMTAEEEAIAKIETEQDRNRETLAQQQKKTELLQDLKATERQIVEAKASVAEHRAAYEHTLNEDGWRALLASALEQPIEEHETRVELLRDRRNEAVVTARLAEGLTSNPDNCPTCHGHLDDEQAAALHAAVHAAEGVELVDKELHEARASLATLRRMPRPDARGQLIELEKAFRRAERDLKDLEDRAKSLTESLSDVNTDDLARLIQRGTQLGIQLQKHQDMLKAEEQKYQESNASAAQLRDKVTKAPGITIDPAVSAANAVASALSELFSSSVDGYRDRQRHQVEESASTLFLKMRSEQDFRGLVVNEQYGLSILNDKGAIVPERSAGYEHLTAMATIGGLRAASTIEAPIIMDSPFGRLDPVNKKGVLGNVHHLAGQVVLLVHEGEVNTQEAHELIGEHLQAEYEIQRISSEHTVIKERLNSND
jgi:DNA sulfur modification protein DndD